MSESTRHRGAVGATLAGILDRVGGGEKLAPNPTWRLDGLDVMVTGANRGLGLAISRGLAARGARLWMACRSRLEVAEAVAAETGGQMEALPVDLADFQAIDRLVAALVERGVALDRLVLNAGVVPAAARTTPAGLDIMFHVNFLANLTLTRRLLDAGVLRAAEGAAPRVIVVGSDAHRSG